MPIWSDQMSTSAYFICARQPGSSRFKFTNPLHSSGIMLKSGSTGSRARSRFCINRTTTLAYSKMTNISGEVSGLPQGAILQNVALSPKAGFETGWPVA